MIWQQLSLPWQACLQEAWASYCAGSLPHGAVVTDGAGTIIARGRNCVRNETEGNPLKHNPIAHAELNAVLNIDWHTHMRQNRSEYVLYSVIEPCAMCMGAVLMAHMRQVHFAARDSQTGASCLSDKTPFFREQQFSVTGPEDKTLEIVLIALQLESVLNMPPMPMKQAWADRLASEVAHAGALGHQLYETKVLQQWRDTHKTAAFVFDQLENMLK